MPTYQYTCTDCGEQVEVVQKFTDDPLTVCPACGGKLRKVFSPVGIVFKGSGFYRTDSRKSPTDGPGKKDKDKESSGSKSADSSSGSSKDSGSSSSSGSDSSSSSSSGSGSSGSGSSGSGSSPSGSGSSGSSGSSSGSSGKNGSKSSAPAASA